MLPSVLRTAFAVVVLTLIAGLAAFPAWSQPISGQPARSVNLIGPTLDPFDIPDVGLKQQNEPACAIRPDNPGCVICAYNDYRTVDNLGDAWQGVSMSCDVGTGDTWESRIAPGHPGHPHPVDAAFAADPSLAALPGMAIFNFIGGYREENRGVLAIQHWLEVNREDSDPYEPAARTVIAESGTEGRFIDKPDMLAILDSPDGQGTISLDFEMENPDLGTISRAFPTGDLIVAYAVFTGSSSIKLQVKTSDDWGKTWKNQSTKLSEGQNLVSGISLTAIGDTVLAVWRRAGDNNDRDSIMYAVSDDRGKKWTKGEVLADICRFDQVSFASGDYVTFRTNDFPWTANDGENFYVFYSDRNWNGESDCSSGKPRIVFHHSTPDSIDWSNGPAALDDSAAAGPGLQFMPTAFGAKGKVQVAWYDSRREATLPDPLAGLEYWRDSALGDYATPVANVHRKVDVYTARITADKDGDGKPEVSEATRVSRYRIAAEEESGEVAREVEANFANLKLYASGSLPFIGDYIAMAAPEFRRVLVNGETRWMSNAIEDSTSDKVDFFSAWTDQRDVRGRIFPDDLGEKVPYEQTGTGTDSTSETTPENSAAEKADTARFAGLHGPYDPPRDVSKTAEGLVATEDWIGSCADGSFAEPQDRTRNANIYGSLIEDRIQLYTPTPTKPLGGIQRAFPIALRNPNDTETLEYRLRIETQPCDFPEVCRASWRQKPSIPVNFGDSRPDLEEDLSIAPGSALARTVFVVGQSESDSVLVSIYDAAECQGSEPNETCVGASPLLTTVIGGTDTGTSGLLQQPVYRGTSLCEGLTDADFEECFNNLENELHNPELANPDLLNPELANPELLNPELLNPELANPELLNPELANPDLLNPELANPELANPELANPELLNSALTDGDGKLVLDDDGNPVLDPELSRIDYTYAITNTGNITTAYNADLTLAGTNEGDETHNVDSQLIAYTLQIVPTSRDCFFREQYEPQILAVVNMPGSGEPGTGEETLKEADLDNPFEGRISAIAKPGQTIYFTRRVFGTPAELERVSVSGFTASSQAANCSETSKDGEIDSDYVCEDNLDAGREKILVDTLPPKFSGVPDATVFLAAEDADGVCVDLAAELGITATDKDLPVAVACTAGFGSCGADDQREQVPVSPTDADPYTVTCTATDDSGNTAEVGVPVKVTDQAAPMITGPAVEPIVVDEAGTDTATVDLSSYVTVTDNVDPPADIKVECSAIDSDGNSFSGTNLTLLADTYDVTCQATDTAGNQSESVGYVLEIKDRAAPTIEYIGEDPRYAPAETVDGATVDFLGDIQVEDNVDPSPGVTCEPASGSFFPLTPDGTVVTCTATDSAGNTSNPVTFRVVIQYGEAYGIEFSKDNVQSGSSVPLEFGWRDASGSLMDSSAADPVVTAKDCATGMVVLEPGEFPGNSDLRWDASQNIWKFNWQTVCSDSTDQEACPAGSPLPATGAGTDYCVQVISTRTGQTIPENDGFTRITVKD